MLTVGRFQQNTTQRSTSHTNRKPFNLPNSGRHQISDNILIPPNTKRLPIKIENNNPDVFKTNEIKNPTVSKTGILNHFKQVQKKEETIKSMLVRNKSMGKPEEKKLVDQLSRVDPAFLEYAQKNGVKIQMVKPGESLIENGAITPLSTDKFQQNIPNNTAIANRVLETTNHQFSDKMAAARDKDKQNWEKSKKSGFGGFGGFTSTQSATPPAMGNEAYRVNEKRRKKVNERLEKETKGQVMLYDPASGVPEKFRNTSYANGMIAVQSGSTSNMAKNHGARTPEELKAFSRMVEQLNGPRLQKARKEGLEHFRKMLKDNGIDEKKINKQIEHFKKHPEEIPIDHSKHDILVPNLFYYHTEDKKSKPGNGTGQSNKPGVPVNYHDYSTLRSWQGKDGRVMDQATSKRNGLIMNGQYLPDKKLILIRSDNPNLERKGTAIHELGHSIDFIMEKKNPGFYKQWRQQVDQSYDKTSKDSSTWISSYSRTNKREYIAECFTATYNGRRKVLNTMDPTMGKLIADMKQGI